MLMFFTVSLFQFREVNLLGFNDTFDHYQYITPSPPHPAHGFYSLPTCFLPLHTCSLYYIGPVAPVAPFVYITHVSVLTCSCSQLSSFCAPQGARGFPGTPGLPGMKGHRVRTHSH